MNITIANTITKHKLKHSHKRVCFDKCKTTISRLRGLDPTYFPPACMNYRCPELEDRVDVPQELFPEV